MQTLQGLDAQHGGESFPSRHKVWMRCAVNTKEMEELARRLAVEMGVAPEKLLGANATPMMIEGEVVVEAETADGDDGDDDDSAP